MGSLPVLHGFKADALAPTGEMESAALYEGDGFSEWDGLGARVTNIHR